MNGRAQDLAAGAQRWLREIASEKSVLAAITASGLIKRNFPELRPFRNSVRYKTEIPRLNDFLNSQL